MEVIKGNGHLPEPVAAGFFWGGWGGVGWGGSVWGGRLGQSVALGYSRAHRMSTFEACPSCDILLGVYVHHMLSFVRRVHCHYSKT